MLLKFSCLFLFLFYFYFYFYFYVILKKYTNNNTCVIMDMDMYMHNISVFTNSLKLVNDTILNQIINMDSNFLIEVLENVDTYLWLHFKFLKNNGIGEKCEDNEYNENNILLFLINNDLIHNIDYNENVSNDIIIINDLCRKNRKCCNSISQNDFNKQCFKFVKIYIFICLNFNIIKKHINKKMSGIIPSKFKFIPDKIIQKLNSLLV